MWEWNIRIRNYGRMLGWQMRPSMPQTWHGHEKAKPCKWVRRTLLTYDGYLNFGRMLWKCERQRTYHVLFSVDFQICQKRKSEKLPFLRRAALSAHVITRLNSIRRKKKKSWILKSELRRRLSITISTRSPIALTPNEMKTLLVEKPKLFSFRRIPCNTFSVVAVVVILCVRLAQPHICFCLFCPKSHA